MHFGLGTYSLHTHVVVEVVVTSVTPHRKVGEGESYLVARALLMCYHMLVHIATTECLGVK